MEAYEAVSNHLGSLRARMGAGSERAWAAMGTGKTIQIVSFPRHSMTKPIEFRFIRCVPGYLNRAWAVDGHGQPTGMGNQWARARTGTGCGRARAADGHGQRMGMGADGHGRMGGHGRGRARGSVGAGRGVGMGGDGHG